jgi:hypothetical protein
MNPAPPASRAAAAQVPGSGTAVASTEKRKGVSLPTDQESPKNERATFLVPGMSQESAEEYEDEAVSHHK